MEEKPSLVFINFIIDECLDEIFFEDISRELSEFEEFIETL